MKEIPAGGCSYIYLVGDFSFGCLPEDKQLLVVPFVMRTLRMAGLGECSFDPLHPEDEEVTGIRLCYAGYREGDGCDSCLTYTSRYFSLYELPEILVQNPFRTEKSIVELGEENFSGLISKTFFITGRVVYPQRDEVICDLQIPTGDLDTDHHMRSMIKSTGNLAIQKFRSLANWVFHSVYDFVGGTIRQATALGFLGSKVPKRLKRRVEIWMTGKQRTSMSRSLAVESELVT